jgi:hypothetical protein
MRTRAAGLDYGPQHRDAPFALYSRSGSAAAAFRTKGLVSSSGVRESSHLPLAWGFEPVTRAPADNQRQDGP